MKFVTMIWMAAGANRLRLSLSMAASTLGVVGVLIMVSTVLDPKAGEGPKIANLLLFAAAALAVVLGNAYGQRLSSSIVEEFLNKTRQRFADLVRRSDYGRFEAVGGHSVYDSLTRNSPTLTEAALLALHCLSALGALILGSLFTLFLSPLVFGVIVGLIGVSFVLTRLAQHRTGEALTLANANQLSFFTLFRHLLDGFKEVKLHRPRGDDLENNFLRPQSELVRNSQVEAAIQINRNISINYILFYVMLATIAFVLPSFIKEQSVIIQAIYVAVFMLSIVEVLLKSMPTIARASFALEELNNAFASLETAIQDDRESGERRGFETIEANGLVYSYQAPDGESSFTMGPVSLDIRKGETLFIVGGNGSGKSTMLKALTRLYEPHAGTLVWDGVPVDASNVMAYRSLFSAVFSDFHLFDRLYGMGDVPEAKVNDLFDELGIANKTQYLDGMITNTNLSTGQRKRLALAVALLEDRPILVLDELAADQDPEFRKAFYEVFLPRWKTEGRTLVVVSHDDRYFRIADRTIVLEDGRARTSDDAQA